MARWEGWATGQNRFGKVRLTTNTFCVGGGGKMFTWVEYSTGTFTDGKMFTCISISNKDCFSLQEANIKVNNIMEVYDSR